MAALYRENPIYAIRIELKVRLTQQSSYRHPGREDRETPAEFWQRVEDSGHLLQALALFDRLEAEERRKSRVPRETKRTFTERVEREGRREEVERVRMELLASGLGDREAQVELVARFQSLDGTETRAWPTPDPWDSGRLFRRKDKELELLRLVKKAEDEEEVAPEVEQAQERVRVAEWRQRERLALAAARRRAQELKVRSQGPSPCQSPVDGVVALRPIFEYACGRCRLLEVINCDACRAAWRDYKKALAQWKESQHGRRSEEHSDEHASTALGGRGE